MTEKLNQKIKEEISKLPKENQEAINTVDWATISEEIGKKFLTSESEINDLQVQILLVLISLTSLDSFARNIENEVGTTKEDAEKIAREVTQKIFIPISDVGIENIRKNLKNKKPTTNQTINFILSGGDYSAFAEGVEPVAADTSLTNKAPITPPTLADIKNNTQNINKPTKMTDIKSKLVI